MSEGIVPEDFDLEDAKMANSTTPIEEQMACPNTDCHSISLHSRSNNQFAIDPENYEDGDYRCVVCNSMWDEHELVPKSEVMDDGD